MERRAFLKTCALACGSGALFSVALSSCKSIQYVNGVSDNNKIRVAKKEFTDENNAARPFVVVRNEELDFPVVIYQLGAEYHALSTKCTHSGCEVQPNKVSLVCPCHGSEFSNKGKVINPPAETDLKNYTVTTDDENIYLQL